jgi:hypothetical protein
MVFAMHASGHSQRKDLKTNVLSGDVMQITSFRFGEKLAKNAVHNVRAIAPM